MTPCQLEKAEPGRRVRVPALLLDLSLLLLALGLTYLFMTMTE